MLLHTTVLSAWGQYGQVDPTFNPLDDGVYGDGPVHFQTLTWDFTPEIHRVLEQPDGRLLVGGKVQAYDHTRVPGLFRVHPDGRIDSTFLTGSGESVIHCMHLLPDGRILIGGALSDFNGIPVKNITRLMADGSIDTTFDPGNGPWGIVNEIRVDAEGRILIGGLFSAYDGVPRNNLARLHSDGTLDVGFAPLGTNYAVRALALDGQDRILIGGDFTTVNDATRPYIARLSSTGELESGFDPAVYPYGVRALALDGEQRILVGGSATGNPAFPRMIRMLDDGSSDPDFDLGSGFDQRVMCILPLHDGRIMVGGGFEHVNELERTGLVRLNADGSVDTEFGTMVGRSGSAVYHLQLQQDGRLLVSGHFRRIGAFYRGGLARLLASDQVDTSFNPTRGASGPINDMLLLSDERIIISGYFETYNDAPRPNLAMLTPDGELDGSFNPGAWIDTLTMGAMALLPSGQILVATEPPYSPDGSDLFCLELNGSLCNGFTMGTIQSGDPSVIIAMENGSALVGGDFTMYNGHPCQRIVRIHGDGSVDTSFIGPESMNGAIHHMAILPDGRIILAGSFTMIDGTAKAHLACLFPDGTLDPSFDPGSGPYATAQINELRVHGTDHIVVSGDFTFFNGEPSPGLAVLDQQGAHATGFSPQFDFLHWVTTYGVTSTAIHDDGRLVAVGWFTEYDGEDRFCMVRTMADGSVDHTFDTGPGPSGWLGDKPRIVRIDQHGRYLVSGDFIRFNGASAHRLVRIHGASGLGVNEHSMSPKLQIYPNPAHEQLYFSEVISGTVHDVQGRTLRMIQRSNHVHLDGLTSGSYLIRTEDGRALRFIKE